MIAQELTPISQQLAELSTTLKEVSPVADTVMEIGLALQDKSKRLQHSEQLLVDKEAQFRASNLKFCELPESPNFNALKSINSCLMACNCASVRRWHGTYHSACLSPKPSIGGKTKLRKDICTVPLSQVKKRHLATSA